MAPYFGGVLLGPGRVRSGVAGKETVIGELDGESTERVRRIAAAMNAAGPITQVSPNIMRCRSVRQPGIC